MEIKSAEFIISNAVVSKCPNTNNPEYAFIGRSNVGKSSLINMLTGRSKLAKTSATPGKTMLINHFLINNEWYLVDLRLRQKKQERQGQAGSDDLQLHPEKRADDQSVSAHRLPSRASEDRPEIYGMAGRKRSTVQHRVHQSRQTGRRKTETEHQFLSQGTEETMGGTPALFHHLFRKQNRKTGNSGLYRADQQRGHDRSISVRHDLFTYYIL